MKSGGIDKMNSGSGTKSRRVTPSDMGIHRFSFCWRCGKRVDNEQRDECGKCGWIKCKCGGCGCGYNREGSEHQTFPEKYETAEVRETAGVANPKVDAVIKCQRKIKKAFARLMELHQVDDEEKILSFFQQTLAEVKQEFSETIYFFDLLWLVASEIKDLMEAKKPNLMMAGLSERLRNKWIRFVPGDLSRSGKAFWGLNNDDWIRLRNNG
jgi:hypothetical protein